MPDDSPIRPPASPPPSSPAALRPLGITVYVCILLLVAVAGVKTWRDLGVVEAREADLRRAIAVSRVEIEALEERIERLDSDPLALERLAREELGMVYPGDVVVVLPPEDGAERTSTPRR
jgi:cell division protein FtsB